MFIQKNRQYGDFTPFLEKEEQFQYAVHELTLSHQKKNHWIWFLFPNLEKHGKSYYSKYFGLHDEREAELFYENETLRKRLFSLFEIIDTLLDRHSIDFIMGSVIDIIKFISCIDLFYPLLRKEEETKLLDSIRLKISKGKKKN